MKDDESEENYVKKGPSAKALWYLPIIPQFKRLFANVNDAKNLRWHANGKKSNGLLCDKCQCVVFMIEKIEHFGT